MLFRQVLVLFFLAGITAAAAPAPGCAAFTLLAWADSRAWRPAGFGAALLCALAGWIAGGLAEPPPAPEAPAWQRRNLEDRKAVRVRGEVVSVSGLADRRLRIVLAEVRPVGSDPLDSASASSDTAGCPGGSDPDLFAALPGRLAWTWDWPEGRRPLAGQTLEVTLRIRPARGFRNDGGWDSERYWRRRGVLFQAWSRGSDGDPRIDGSRAKPGEALRERLRAAVVAVFAAPSSASGSLSQASFPAGGESRSPDPAIDAAPDRGWTLLPALLFGDRFHLRTPDVERMVSAGLAHSMALSGQHLAVVGLVSLAIVALIGRLRPEAFLHVPASRLAALCALPPAAIYLWLGGAPVSLVRAGLMLAFWAFFLWRDRPAAFPDALMAALTCMILADPLTAHDVGAQLSFSAVAGIALIAPLASGIGRPAGEARRPRSRFGRIVARTWRGLRLLLVCSVAAQLATWPLVMTTFGHFTWWFPLNLIWLPALGFWVLPLAFFGLICLAPACSVSGAAVPGLNTVGAAALKLAAWPCDLLFRGLERLESDWGMSVVWGLRPHWSVVLGLAALFVGLALLARDRLPRKERAGAPLLPVPASAGAPDRMLGRMSGSSFDPSSGPTSGRACSRPGGLREHVRNAARSPAGRLILAAVPLLLIGPCLRLWAERAPEVTLRVFDVGQSQAVLLEWPDKGRRGRALVDGGGFFSNRFDSGRDIIAPLLTANRPAALDWLILSHPDRDHLKGLLFFAAHFAVRGACTADFDGDSAPGRSASGAMGGTTDGAAARTEARTAASAAAVPHRASGRPRPLYARFTDILETRGIPRHTLHAGDRIALAPERCPELFLEVLAPAKGERAEGNNGLVLRLVNRGKGLALLPGDAEAACLRRILRRLPPEAFRADVLVLPHHGSAGSFLPALYDAARPRVAVASAGMVNAYRLPADRVRQELARRGIPLHVTAEDGEFSRRWNADF